MKLYVPFEIQIAHLNAFAMFWKTRQDYWLFGVVASAGDS
jgi:hypothetical protein